MKWTEVTHPETGGTARVRDEPSVLASFAARGWVRKDEAGAEDATGSDNEPAADPAADTTPPAVDGGKSKKETAR